MQTELKIQTPEGMEIDKEKSTFELIVFKQIKSKYPQSAAEIKGLNWYLTASGKVCNYSLNSNDPNNLSTESRAKAFLALMQLVELRDAWNKVDDFTPNFANYTKKYCITTQSNVISYSLYLRENRILYFGSRETRDLFLETFKELVEEAKELL